LFSQLKSLGLRVIPSQANFLLFFPEVDIAALNLRLLKRGVIIRPAGGFGIPEAMRVTIGLEKENNFFIAALKEAMKETKK
jgi:histidinol-phosphate aminotransferase